MVTSGQVVQHSGGDGVQEGGHAKQVHCVVDRHRPLAVVQASFR